MKIAMIAAMANNRVIGLDNDMPWHLPDDLKFFKAMTTGKPVIMGRKTFESLKGPLPQRANIIVTRQSDYAAKGCIVAHDLSQALKSCPPGEDEAFIIGGGQLYQAAFAMTDRIYLTVIPRDIDGDTYNIQNTYAYRDSVFYNRTYAYIYCHFIC